MDQVLWACRTSPKEVIATTTFRLTYGHEVVLRAEMYLQSVQIQRQNGIPSNQYWNMMLDEMVGLDEERLAALDALMR